MKVALVHDYLIEYGGAERVLEALHEIYPEAPLYVAYFDLGSLGISGKKFRGWDIRTSWLQRFPKKLISPFRIFAPMIFENFDLSEYDLVISSCNTYFSKAVITKPESLHISYIHTPPRYLYGYTTSFNYKKHMLTRWGGELANHFLRIWDFETSQRPDILIANSKNVQERIKKFYRRESIVIYPPVELERFTIYDLRFKKREYFLTVGRLVRGKGIDTIVEACGRLGLHLKVVGIGPEMENLKSRAAVAEQISNLKCVEFLGQVNDEELAKLYAGAKATIVASEDEDFGIVAVESQAAGTPVIAVKAGGFLETVTEKTGTFFDGSVDDLVRVLREFREEDFKAQDYKKQAEKFSIERFQKQILELVEKTLDKNKK